jgi:hypothetical protein
MGRSYIDNRALATLADTYQLSANDIACIVLYISTGNKTFAFGNTIGKGSNSKSFTQRAHNFFNNVEVIKFIKEQKFNIVRFFEDGTKSHKEEEEDFKTTLDYLGDLELTDEQIITELNKLYKSLGHTKEGLQALDKLSSIKLKLKAPDSKEDKPLVYRPLKCKGCKYKPNK